MTILLEDYDTSREAMIEPEMIAPAIEGFPEIAVTCYSSKLLEQALEGRKREYLCTLDTEDGGIPVYRIWHGEREIAVYLSRVGAPACVVQFEEIIARGAKRFVMFGSCGVLKESIGKWNMIVPTEAFRDEGVSYHYLPPSETVAMQQKSIKHLCDLLAEVGESYICGKVWTTDAIYRETRAKTEKRRKQGCIAVDMECASVQAVAQFRGVKLAQFFYAEDHLGVEEWDDRGLTHGILKEARRLFDLAVRCAVRL